MTSPSPSNNPLFASHSRGFAANRCIYPVISRRAGGISIGVNLNPDKFCNFDCAYCQIDRTTPGSAEPVDLERLADELDQMVQRVVSGKIFEDAPFRVAPPTLRRLNDIAFSGDGEPTACRCFSQAVDICAAVRRKYKLDDVKIVLITNATLFHQPRVREALKTLDANNGEIWAKLDAGSESYYRTIDRSSVPWERILENLKQAALERPIVIQSLFMRVRGESVSQTELEAYCERLREITTAGGQIKLVQVHTIARPPTESWATGITNAEVDAIAELVRSRTGLPVAGYYGMSGS